MEFNETHPSIKNLPAGARRDWAVAAIVGGSEKAGWDYLKKAGWAKQEHKWELKKSASEGEKFTAGVRLSKAEKSGDDMYVTLVASGFNVDKANEQMEKSALDKMMVTCKAGNVGMRESHSTTFPIAKSVDAYLNESNDMEVKMKLDKAHPFAGYLFDRVSKGEAEEQASVYGFVTKKDYVWNAGLKKMVKSIKDVSLSFIDLTPPTEGCYPASGFVEAIAKQVSWEKEPSAPSLEGAGKGETMEELIKQIDAVAEAMAKAMTPEFKVEAHMLDGQGALRKDFKAEFEASRKSLTDEQKTLLSKSVEKLLNAAGIDTVPVDEVPATPAEGLSKSKALKKLAKALGVDKETLAKQLGLVEEDPAPAVIPGLEELQKQLKEQGEVLAKIANGTLKGRAAAPGEGVLIQKNAPAAGETLSLTELTPMMKQVGEAAKGDMLTADGKANARALSSSFVKKVAEAAISSDMAALGIDMSKLKV